MNSFHQLTAFTISQLVVLLQLKYQTQTPFTTLPATMMVAVASMLVYYFLYIGLLGSPTSSPFAAAAKHLVVWSSYVAISALACALFPNAAAPFIYSIFGLLSAGQVLYMFLDDLAIEGDGEAASLEITVAHGDGEAPRLEIYRKYVRRLFKKVRDGVSDRFLQLPAPILPV